MLRDVALPVMISMSSVLSSRFILHLREHVSERCQVESRSLASFSFQKGPTTRESRRVTNTYSSHYC